VDVEFHFGDRVEYTGEPVFDGIIDTGEVGHVLTVEDGWVKAHWPRSGIHSVPVANVRLLPPEVTRTVGQQGNQDIWPLVGEKMPSIPGGRRRDPYWEQGSHPELVDRVWDELGRVLPRDCRAQANGRPVLAHPRTDRIFAKAHGTAYALWLTPDDYTAALEAGAKTTMTWTGGKVTDLATEAGPGWIWGSWDDAEAGWVRHSYDAAGPAEDGPVWTVGSPRPGS
jgi:hypothetical protein